MNLDNYECEGQMSIFDYLASLPPKECSFSGHVCNKENLWEVADTFDDFLCPHVCCRKCNTKSCGARCNGSEEPKSKEIYEDEYIKEHPDCFYVTGYYLSKTQGWHKVPEELPTFKTWQLVDVVVFGKKTNTPCMELKKWEAKDWTFRSVGDWGNRESCEVLAWKLSKQDNEEEGTT